MKILKYIGIGILAIIVLFLIIGIFMPKTVKVERSVTINAPANVVMQQVSSLQKMQEWSPWADRDPNMTVTYEGNEGEVGSKSKWAGNEEVGKGEQTITAITDNRVETSLNFIEPWESQAQAYVQLGDDNGATKVTWGFTSELPYPWNAMGLFMNMEDAAGKDFDQGLNKLKAICESMPAAPAARTFDIHEMDQPGRILVGKRAEVSFNDLQTFFMTNLEAIGKAMEKAKVAPTGPPVGVYYKWDDKEMKTDLAIGMPMSNANTKVPGFDIFTIPAGKAVHIAYYGSYEKSGEAHMAIDKYMADKGLKLNEHVLEEYVTGPDQEPDTAKWLTNIYYMIK